MDLRKAVFALIECVGEERFREALGKLPCDEQPEERELIRQVLREMGVQESYEGFRAAVIGVELTLERDLDICGRLTKEIIPDIAAEMGKPWKAAEKNLRWAMECAWKHMPPEERARWYGTAVVKPKVGSFLLTVAAEVRRRTIPEIGA